MAKLKRAPIWATIWDTVEEDDDSTQEEPTAATLKKIDKTWTILIEREDGTRDGYRFASKTKALRWARLAGLELEEVADQRVAPNLVYYEGFGEKHILSQWAKLLNLPRSSLSYYLHAGLTIEEVARIRKTGYPAK